MNVDQRSAEGAGSTRLRRVLRTPLLDLLSGRVTGGRKAQQLVADSGLPEEVKGLIATLIAKTRLWQWEKLEVTRELIAHFQDGIVRGESAAALIESFGDPHTAARLIRRARQRLRPGFHRGMRRIVQVAGVMVAALVCLYLVAAGRFFLRTPSPSVDYLASLNASAAAVPDADRAWPMYRQALLMLDDPPRLPGNEVPKPGDEHWPAYAAYLKSQRPGLEYFVRASRQPGFGMVLGFEREPADVALFGEYEKPTADGVWQDSLITLQLPHLASLRRLSMLALDEASRLAFDAQDGAGAVELIAASLRVAEHIREHPILINDLVSLAITAAACERAGHLLVERAEVFQERDLHHLAHAAAALPERAFRVRVSAERLFFKDLLQRTYTDGGWGGGHVTSTGIDVYLDLSGVLAVPMLADENFLANVAFNAASPLASVVIAGRNEMLRKYEELLAIVESESLVPLWERTHSRFDEEIEQLRASRVTEARYLPVTLIMPAIGHATIQGEYTIQIRDALLVAIALEIYRRRQGAWPASLDDLVPSLLPMVPSDRFDGRTIKYVVQDGQPVLYSVGGNREDQGGYPATDRYGRPLPDAARRWFSPERLAENRQRQARGEPTDIPDGDWILWPR